MPLSQVFFYSLLSFSFFLCLPLPPKEALILQNICTQLITENRGLSCFLFYTIDISYLSNIGCSLFQTKVKRLRKLEKKKETSEGWAQGFISVSYSSSWVFSFVQVSCSFKWATSCFLHWILNVFFQVGVWIPASLFLPWPLFLSLTYETSFDKLFLPFCFSLLRILSLHFVP